MVGAKVSIVSPKVQTTRSRVRGIFVRDDCEIVLVDTPGIFKPRKRLDRAMVAAAWSEAEYADVRLLLVDARRGLDDDTRSIVDSLKKDGLKTVLLINKTDAAKSEKILALAAELNGLFAFTETFMVSAATGDGVGELEKYLISRMPEGPFMFDPDQVSDLPNRLLAAEITREKLFLNLQQELPYALAVMTDSWRDNADGSARIEQTVYVEHEKQRKIVLGKGGAMIKKIGSEARAELEELLECRVHLFLFVKVREKWAENPELYRPWGLDFNA